MSMIFGKEVTVGTELLRQGIERTGKLKISKTHGFQDRFAQYFLVSSDAKEVDFVLTYEFLADLPATKEYQQFFAEYCDILEHRFQQHSPLDFYCRSGTPFKMEIFWPFNHLANRAASYVQVNVEDLRTPTLIAKCAVLFGMELGIRNPFDDQQKIINSVRQAIDQQSITFYARAAHPAMFQQVETWSMKEPVFARQSDIEQFVSGKVYWLGFRRAGRDAKVWIADPWDAQYLGIEPVALQLAAEVQDARDVLRVDDQNFATAGKGLLIGSSQFESEQASRLALLGRSSKNMNGIRDLLGQLLPPTVSVASLPTEQQAEAASTTTRSLIERSDFIVFDVASDDPNTFFEIGFAQALKKKLLLLVPRDQATKLPFEIASSLYLSYDPENLSTIREELASYIQRYWGLVVRR